MGKKVGAEKMVRFFMVNGEGYSATPGSITKQSHKAQFLSCEHEAHKYKKISQNRAQGED